MVFCHTYLLATSVSLTDKQNKQNYHHTKTNRITTIRMSSLLVLKEMFVYKQEASTNGVSSKSAIFLNPSVNFSAPLHLYDIPEI